MKIITYHYVPIKNDRPYPIGLSHELFERQLKYFLNKGEVVTRKNWREALSNANKDDNLFMLTFDDGLKSQKIGLRMALKGLKWPKNA